MAETLKDFVDKVLNEQSLKLNSVYADYLKPCLPTKFKPSSTEKAKHALLEAIDITTYEEAARMVAFKIPCAKLAQWIKTLQLLYYEFYGTSSDHKVIWVDNPEKWEKDTSSKSICIDLETRKPSNPNPLLYKLTLFINTGLVQIQGNKKDACIHKDFPAQLEILDKVTKTVTESRQNLDKEQTALKCVEESTDNKLVTTNDKNEDLYNENGPLACCQPLKPDNLSEKIESNFTMALQKICDQQSNLFDKRLQSMEDYYKKINRK